MIHSMIFLTSSMPQPGEITPAHDVDTLNAMAAMQGWDKWQGSGQGLVARAPLQQQNSGLSTVDNFWTLKPASASSKISQSFSASPAVVSPCFPELLLPCTLHLGRPLLNRQPPPAVSTLGGKAVVAELWLWPCHTYCIDYLNKSGMGMLLN